MATDPLGFLILALTRLWIQVLILQLHCIPVVTAFGGEDGENLSNNLFSDLGPILALFGEQVTKQFIAGSTSWEEHVILAMAPLGIITVIVAAIRIGGPAWLKGIIGRGRENKAIAEVELTTSTSEDVCELWNGSTIVRIMGSPRILQLFFLERARDGKEHGLFTLTGKGAVYDHSQVMYDDRPSPQNAIKTLAWFTTTALSQMLVKFDNVNPSQESKGKGKGLQEKPRETSIFDDAVVQKTFGTWTHALFSLPAKLQIKHKMLPQHDGNPNSKVPSLGHPANLKLDLEAQNEHTATDAQGIDSNQLNTETDVKSKSNPDSAQMQIPTVEQPRNKSQEGTRTPNIFLNLHVPKTWGHVWELRGLAIVAVIIQAGVVVFWAFGTYHPSMPFKRDAGSEIAIKNYAFPLTAGGTVILITGILICAYIVDGCTVEEFWRLKKTMGKAKILWIQQGGNINDQHFESYAIFAKEERDGIMTSRLSPYVKLVKDSDSKQDPAAEGQHQKQSVPIDEDSADASLIVSSKPIQILVIIGTVMSVAGFIAQFTGLRAMHWSASIAQLISIFLLAIIRAWIRRDLDSDPVTYKIPKGYELDWTATRLTAAKYMNLWGEGRIEDSKFNEQSLWHSEDLSDKTRKSKEADPRNYRPKLEFISSSSTYPTGFSKAHKVMKIRERLGFLSEWRGRATEPAITVANTIEIVMNNLFVKNTETEARLSLPVQRGDSQADSKFEHIQLSLSRTGPMQQDGSRRSWRMASSEIEALLSLWIYSVEAHEPKTSISPEKLEESSTWSYDWCRHGKAEVLRLQPTMRLLGPSTRRYAKDTSWYLGSRHDRILQVNAKGSCARTDDHWKIQEITLKPNLTAQPVVEKPGGNDEINIKFHRVSHFREALSIVRKTPMPGRKSVNQDGISVDDQQQENERKNNECLELLGILSDLSLETFYAQEILASFMWAASEKIDRIEGESIMKHAGSWDHPLIENSVLTKMQKEIEVVWNEELGPLDYMYHIILQPLSLNSKLPIPSYLVPYARNLASDREKDSKWEEATKIYTWLLDESLEFGPTYPHSFKLRACAAALEFYHTLKGVEELSDDPSQRALIGACKIELWNRLMPMKENTTQNPSWDREVFNCKELLLLHDFQNTLHDRLHRLVLNSLAGEKLEATDIVEKANALLRVGEAPNTQDSTGWTPLHYAVRGDLGELVELLCPLGGINSLNIAEKTPLHYARSAEITRTLLRERAKINIQGRDGLAPIHCAVKGGHIEVVKILLDEGADIDHIDNFMRTPLHLAAYLGNNALVDFLVQRGAGILARDCFGQVPLHLAARNNTLTKDIFQKLQGTTQLDIPDRKGRTPLYIAIVNDRIASMELLLNENACLNGPNVVPSKDIDTRQLFHLAVRAGSIASIQYLLKRVPKDDSNTTASTHNELIQSSDTSSRTPLHIASAMGHAEVVDLLLKSDASVEKTDHLGATPLHLACADGHEEVVARLLEAQGDINVKTDRGDTPLQLAINGKHTAIVTLLLQKQGSKEVMNNSALELLQRASLRGDVDIVRELLKSQEILKLVNLKNDRVYDGATPLHLASREGHEQIVELLLSMKADIEAKDNLDAVPLHLASARGHEAVVRMLLSHPTTVAASSVAAKTQSGETPLLLATRNNHVAVVQLLLEHGADIETRDEDGRTSLHLAAKCGTAQVVRLLLEHGEARDENMQTALDLAGTGEVKRLLTPDLEVERYHGAIIVKNCKNAKVTALRQKIIAIGLPKDINLHTNFGMVKLGNNAAIKCRFYPISELRKLLTLQVVESILNHDCQDYCDHQRRLKVQRLEPPWEGEERYLSNKDPELSAQWAAKVVGGSLLTIFGLLVVIKRPLLIIDFCNSDIHDGNFPGICDMVTEDNVVQFWPSFDRQDPNASREAATVFMKHMWSFIPPHLIQKFDSESPGFTVQVFNPRRIVPIVSYEHVGKGGFGTVYAVKIHKDYCHPPAGYEAEAYALKQIVSDPVIGDLVIEKEIQTLKKIQSHPPHANIIRFLSVFKHMSFNMDPAYHLLMPLMQGNLEDHFRQEAAYGFRTIVEGELYKQLIGIVGAIYHMIYTIKAHRLDLKPTNILLKTVWDISAGREHHILVLADFGHARIERSGRMSTAGNAVTFDTIMTDAYAPPEGFRDGDAWVPRNMCPPVVPEKWDIWPLAGIFVEVLTFMALGCVGIKHLERHRHESYDDYRFWVSEEQELKSSDPGEPKYGLVPVLKDTIDKWLDILWDADFEKFEHFKLEASETEMQDQCKSFLQWNIELVRHMFQPSPSDRPTINEILQHMEEKLLNPEPFFPSIKSSTDLYKLLGIQKPDLDDAEGSIFSQPQYSQGGHDFVSTGTGTPGLPPPGAVAR